MDNIWKALAAHRAATEATRIETLVTEARVADFTVEACNLALDWSKTAINPTARDLLLDLAREAGVEARRDAMFAGERINETEDRAVLHTALRKRSGSVMVDGQDVMPGIRETLARMRDFAQQVRSGDLRPDGMQVTDVVNIGIGGSDLGPAMAVRALSPCHDGPRVHFVSNVDGADITDTLAPLNPATTLIVVSSKTFTTIETMTNADSARRWLEAKVEDPAGHFAAVSTALDRTAAFGIPDDRVFGFADWVGGRYSMWGPIGLALMLAIGPAAFDEMRAGGAAMDAHFRTGSGNYVNERRQNKIYAIRRTS